MMKNILIFGYIGYGNLGDETNLKHLVELIRGVDVGIEMTVVSAAPELTAAENKIRAIGKPNFFGIIKALRKADLLLGNGGSLFQDVTSMRSLIYYSALIVLAKLFRVKVFLYGQGIGPLRSGIGKKLTGWVLSMANLITVRDRLSIIALAELNVRKPEIHFTAEPLLALDKPADGSAGGYWKGMSSGKQIKLGLIIRQYKFISKDFWERLLDCLKWEAHIETYLIPVQPKENGFLRELAARFGLSFLEIKDGWQQLQQATSGLDFLVSARLHGLVAGVSQGIPCYGLAADPKVEGFCLQLGIPFGLLTLETEWLGIYNQITKYIMQSSVELPDYQSKLPFWKSRALENQLILRQYLEKL